ncbi:MAG TPA: hypothetical protein VHF58_11515 [Solirubrobacterales bacterium]|nr:hypothetical protein [Solirubrobacterales bacterium]
MDRERAQPEELPPLELTKIRDLLVHREEGDEAPGYIRSASAVVRRADYAYVVGDDELAVGVFRLSQDEPGELRTALPGELPSEAKARKKAKPDLEVLTTLPPTEDAPFGGLLGLGSGSNEHRDRGFFWALDARGELDGEPVVIELSPLYRLLRDRIGDLNVEGAAILGDRFMLFHRGNAKGTENAIAELSLEHLRASLRGDNTLDVDELESVRSYDLGELGDTRLAFSDAAPLSEDLVVFTASAETEAETAVDDGQIRGSVVGTIDRDGNVKRLRTIDRKWKVEGVHAAIEAGVIDFVFVCDQDDPDEPSPLLSATMPIEGGFEYSE